MVPLFLGLIRKPADLVIAPPVTACKLFSCQIFRVSDYFAAPVVIFHQVRHHGCTPAIWILTAFTVALPNQHELRALAFQKRSAGKRHCMIIK